MVASETYFQDFDVVGVVLRAIVGIHNSFDGELHIVGSKLLSVVPLDVAAELEGAVISGAVGYAVLSGWCIAIVCKNTKTRISFIKIFVLPVLAGIATLFVYKHMNLYLIGINSSIVNIIVKCLFVVSVYCILCFLCGMLNFRRFFRDFVSKKNKANA